MKRLDIIVAGDEIYTKDGTVLRAVDVTETSATFEEYEYNDESEKYDILGDDFRVLSKSEIENIMHDYDGDNHCVTLVPGTQPF